VLEQSLQSDPWEGEPSGALRAFIRPCIKARLPGAPAGIAVDAARHQRWLDIVGADHWSVTVGGWVLLAVNAQLLGSGLAAEAAQWSWLEEQAGRHRGREPVALITHKPVTAAGTELAAARTPSPGPSAKRSASSTRASTEFRLHHSVGEADLPEPDAMSLDELRGELETGL
jgi:hypothetical protein